ncbi:MAG: hypothetical protein KC547_07545 [Anaerolineae bacterium]|nr:hypothetical protein [Anaerolineae bacterium]
MHKLTIFARRVLNDVSQGRNLESYVVAALGIALLAAGVLGSVDQSVQMALIIAALTVLVLRSTAPETGIFALDDVLKDRQAFGSFKDFIGDGRTLWMFAPSAVNIFNDASPVKSAILDRGGEVCVILLDPKAETVISYVQGQLDSAGQELASDIRRTVRSLDQLQKSGKVTYGFLPFSPGFSLTIIDPDKPGGRLIVEYHGFRNEFTGNRMHIEITRAQSEYWFDYWVNQFVEMRKVAFAPEPSAS